MRVLFPVERPRQGTYTALRPGELVALDIKSLGRLDRGGGRSAQAAHRSHSRTHNVGWPSARRDRTWPPPDLYAELRPGLGKADTLAFLGAALAFFAPRDCASSGSSPTNGPGYISSFRDRCRELRIRHTNIKPRTRGSNGRAEAFIGTIQRECFYGGSVFSSEDKRGLALRLPRLLLQQNERSTPPSVAHRRCVGSGCTA